MGSEERGQKNMVMPSWDSFQSPPGSQEPPPRELQKTAQEENADSTPKQNDWGNFQSPMTYQGPVDPTSDEGMFDYLLRGTARIGSRAGEQALGAIGNIEKLIKEGLSWAIADSGYLGSERLAHSNKGLPNLHPTSSQLKEMSEKGTSGYTSPKTKGEAEL